MLFYIIHVMSQPDSISKCKDDIRSKVAINDAVITRNTMVTSERLKTVLHLWSDVLARGLPGDWIETGTFKGGTSLLAAKIARAAYESPVCPHKLHRTIWLADSFQGLPYPTATDIVMDDRAAREVESNGGRGARMDKPGSYSGYGGLHYVQTLFSQEGFVNTSSKHITVKFLPGWFHNTLPSARIDKIAILRLDGDMYSSTMVALQNLYSKLEPSGFLIIDDYGWWIQCKHAVDDYFRTHEGWMPALMRDGVTGRWMQKPLHAPTTPRRSESDHQDVYIR